jgi:adenylate/nucleoside-diphosphate kinase
LDFYNNILTKEIAEITAKLPHTHNLRIDSGSLTPEEIVGAINCKIGEPARVLRPLPLKIEDVGDFPGLLTAEIDEDGKPFRRWSLFGIVDPVSLNGPENLVKYGKPEQACEYAGRVFTFSSEENQEKFMRNPKPYLTEKPKLPKNYNIAIIGMSKSGKSTFAK